MSLAEQVCEKLIELANYEFQFGQYDSHNTDAQIEPKVLRDLIRQAQEALGQKADWDYPGSEWEEEEDY